MAAEPPEREDEADEEVGTGVDFVDPVKRDPDDPEEEMPGLDPVVPPPAPD